jgi:hypothetical protein
LPKNDAEISQGKRSCRCGKLDGAQKISHVDGSLVVLLLMTKLVPKLVVRLSDGIEGGSRGNGGNNRSSGGVTVDLGLGAIPGDVASFTATVAGLPSSVQRAAVGSGAVAGDVACQMLVMVPSPSVAMHSPSLPQA